MNRHHSIRMNAGSHAGGVPDISRGRVARSATTPRCRANRPHPEGPESSASPRRTPRLRDPFRAVPFSFQTGVFADAPTPGYIRQPSSWLRVEHWMLDVRCWMSCRGEAQRRLVDVRFVQTQTPRRGLIAAITLCCLLGAAPALSAPKTARGTRIPPSHRKARRGPARRMTLEEKTP